MKITHRAGRSALSTALVAGAAGVVGAGGCEVGMWEPSGHEIAQANNYSNNCGS